MVELYLWEFAIYIIAAICFGYLVACLMAASGASAREEAYEDALLYKDLQIKDLEKELEQAKHYGGLK